MDLFLQAAAAVLLGVILSLMLKRQSGEMGALLAMFVCVLISAAAVYYLKPVFAFLDRLRDLTMLEQPMLQCLLKVVGIAMTSEIVSLICQDSGNAAMGKALSFLATAVILYISIPMLTALIDLVEDILVQV